ncbi:MAG TPA: PadR family transcriptional regulator [Thermoleophilia bacterium]
MAVKHSILGLLHYKDMHGYRIKEHIEKNFGHMWSINHGQIYQSLKKMEEEGLVTMVEVAPSDNGGPNKKLYSITGRGRQEFSQWLASDPEGQMLLRDPFLTRFVFFDFGDRDRALEIIEGQIELYEEQMKRRRTVASRRKQQGSYVSLVAELGLDFNEMYVGWLKRAHKEISENKEAHGPGGVGANSLID